MTMNPQAAIFEKLTASPDIVAAVATWKGGPAITSASPFPEGIEVPFISLAAGVATVTPYQSMLGLSQEITIGCWEDNEETQEASQALAMLVFALLRDGRFESGNLHGAVSSRCSWPVPANNEGFLGYQMTCTVQAYQTQEG